MSLTAQDCSIIIVRMKIVCPLVSHVISLLVSSTSSHFQSTTTRSTTWTARPSPRRCPLPEPIQSTSSDKEPLSHVNSEWQKPAQHRSQKKQTSASHSSTESEIIRLDAGLRMDGLLALDLWKVGDRNVTFTGQNKDTSKTRIWKQTPDRRTLAYFVQSQTAGTLRRSTFESRSWERTFISR